MCCLLNSQNLIRNFPTHLDVKVIFQRCQLILRSKDRLLQLLQLRRNITLRICQRLFACIVIRYHILIGICHFQIISEHFIILDLHRFDAGLFPFLGLQLCQPGLALGLRMSEPVNLLIVSFLDKAAVTDADRRFVHNRCIHKGKQVCQLIHFLLQLHKQRRLQALHNIFDMRQHGQ